MERENPGDEGFEEAEELIDETELQTGSLGANKSKSSAFSKSKSHRCILVRSFPLDDLNKILTQAPSPAKPKASSSNTKFLVETRQKLEDFVRSPQQEMTFPSSLDSKQRQVVHGMAEEMHLEHISVGSGAQRAISVRKPCATPAASPSAATHGQLLSFLVYRGYIALTGKYVDHIAAKFIQLAQVPRDYVTNREKRDATSKNEKTLEMIYEAEIKNRARKEADTFILPSAETFHITFISKTELSFVMDQCDSDGQQLFSMAKIFAICTSDLVDDWEPEGVGKVQEGKEETFFVVIRWASAMRVRTRLGLTTPYQPHITLGFKSSDIHGEHIKKDKSTLLALKH